jgi:ribose transport system substrate-binding protein
MEDRRPYIIQSVVHASTVLKAFQTPGESLRLRDLVTRTHLSKGIVFRLLQTLEACGIIEKVGGNTYRCLFRPVKQRKFKIGFASQGAKDQFTEDVNRSMRSAAEAADGVELLVLDNRYSPKVAVRNAQHFVREHVDLVIEFQTDETVAPIISNTYREAKIPFIAVDIPHPGATYYGANNFQAGLIAGQYLGRWARQAWQGEVDSMVMMELPRAGVVPSSRLTGMVEGIRSVLRHLEEVPVTYIDGNGLLTGSWEAMRRQLRKTKPHHVLVGGINDPSAMGALRAFEEAGIVETCAVVGQNGSPDAREELRRPRTRFIGTVTYHPELYGEGLIRLALDILNFKMVPPAVFIQHQLMTAKNVDTLYPNDQLLSVVRS